MSEENKKSGWGKGLLVVVGLLFVLFVIGAVLDPKKESYSAGSGENLATDMKVMDENVSDDMGSMDEGMVDAPSLTISQMNAKRSAEQYVKMSGFSREGLIDQLSSDAGDGYSVADATTAVDSMNVDWNDNAARSARQYLSMTGFSCKGLIDQLSSSAGDQYTVAQATYGARQAGVC